MTSMVCKPSPTSLVNSNGLSALPDELFLEILSYFPPGPVDLSRPSTAQIARRELLLSLSDVCRNFRRVFRPYLWQRIEVYGGMRAGTQVLRRNFFTLATCGYTRSKPRRHFANELLRQLNVVTVQDPTLAQYIQVVNIEINDATFRPVFVELGRCFSLFPNLHTVKIITRFANPFSSNVAIPAAKRGFKKSVLYPQIRSAVLSEPAYPLISVCPNLESLSTFMESSLLLKSLKGRTSLRTLICPLSLENAAVGKDAPALRQISIRIINGLDIPQVLIKTIRSFTNLRTLTLYKNFFQTNVSTEMLKQAFCDLSPRDRQCLQEVIFVGFASRSSRELFTLPPF